ncbi:L-fuculose kinase [Clostridia bacterium]|nr:L-fuculose kinase [Clostridia bacterium]
MANILAFDFGASSGRAIVGTLGGDGKLSLAEVYRFKNEPVTVGRDFFWDVLSLFKHCKNGLAKASMSGPPTGLAFDTWGVDFGLLGKNGELLNNPFHYRHPHTADAIAELDGLYGGNYNLFRATGISMQPFNSLCQLYAMRRDGNVALKNAAKLLFMPDLFNYFLTGETFAEATIASTSQLAKPSGLQWCPEVFKPAGVSERILSPIVRPGFKVGKVMAAVKSEINLHRDVDVYAAASHDTASAVAAVPSREQDFLYVSSGTWSLLGTVLDKPILTEEAFLGGYTNEGAADGRIRFLKNIMGLWIIQECKRDYELSGEAIGFDQIAARAAAAPAFKCFIDPDDKRFFVPYKMNDKIRDYCRETDQAAPDGIAEIGRCVFESLALAYREAVENLERIAGRKYKCIYIVGGGSGNTLLNQLTADALGRPVYAGVPEATSVGNILCQAAGIGLIANLDEGREVARRSFEIKEYEPRDKEKWDEQYARYKKVTGTRDR